MMDLTGLMQPKETTIVVTGWTYTYDLSAGSTVTPRTARQLGGKVNETAGVPGNQTVIASAGNKNQSVTPSGTGNQSMTPAGNGTAAVTGDKPSEAAEGNI